MPNPYFLKSNRFFLYVNRTKMEEVKVIIVLLKTFLKRAKLREDIFQDLTFFTKYIVEGDDRPDNVALKFMMIQLLIGLY